MAHPAGDFSVWDRFVARKDELMNIVVTIKGERPSRSCIDFNMKTPKWLPRLRFGFDTHRNLFDIRNPEAKELLEELDENGAWPQAYRGRRK